MNDFKAVPLNQAVLDPSKRVNYTQGLVLGVDEFNQEQLYFLERDRLHNRALHGYGTVHGLQVSVEKKDDKPQVMVSPGMAVDSRGQHICVPSGQCCDLNKWLQRNRADVPGKVVGNRLPVYVQLCYRECKTDKVPIPGGPCRTQEESMDDSRIAEDFELNLTLSPPAQLEEDKIREFGELLQQIEITDEPGPFLGEDEMLTLVRAFPGSPPLAGEPLRLPTNEACDILQAMFRVWVTEVRPALLRSGRCGGTSSQENGCVLLAKLELELVETAEGYRVAVDGADNPIFTLTEDQRPYLLTTRLLQEWLMCGRLHRTRPVHTFATLFTRGETTIRAWVHYPDLLSFPDNALTVEVNGTQENVISPITQVPGTNIFDLELQSTTLADGNRVTVRFDATIIETAADSRPLVETLWELGHVYLDREGSEILAYLAIDWPALNDLSDVVAKNPSPGEVLTWVETSPPGEGQWEAANPPEAVIDHGDLNGLEDDDHGQYLKTNGSRILTGDQSAGGKKITNLAQATVSGDAMPYGQSAGGDLSGTYPNPTVARLQGQAVASVDPVEIDDRDVLTWVKSENHWKPQPAPAGADGGAYVQAPGGPYAIVAAGFFSPDGTPSSPIYNDLQVVGADPGNGQYLLWFPEYDYEGYAEETIAYIVKGTVCDPSLNAALDIDPLDDEYIENRLGPAIFQVVELNEMGILVWITQPTLESNTILGVVNDWIEEVENLLHLRTVPRAFMVEISQYPFQAESRPSGEGLKVDIGTATVEELRAIPRIGPTLAERIVATRAEMGGFTAIEDLVRVPGIGEGNLEHIRPFITIRRR